MKRIAVVGMGSLSCIGNNVSETVISLQSGSSGIKACEQYKEYGLRSQVEGSIEIDPFEHIPKKSARFMGMAAAYAYHAMLEAMSMSGLQHEEVSHPRIGLIAGSGGASTSVVDAVMQAARSEKGLRSVDIYSTAKTMSSTVPANLATAFQIKGPSFGVTSACATSAHAIIVAAQQIQLGFADIMFAGGGEEMDVSITISFDKLRALTSKYNDEPQRASRPYDKDRDGFAISGGAAMVVLEEWGHAKARGASILAELVGTGVTSDGVSMVEPSGEGAVRCMEQALDGVDKNRITYINPHGTSTPKGDIIELKAIGEVFGDRIPDISSTKSMTGHQLGAAGAAEAIYSLLMMRHHFIAPSINIDTIDPGAVDFPIVTTCKGNVHMDHILSNSFGFGGTNATLVFRNPRYS